MEGYFSLFVIVSRLLYVNSYGNGAPSSACVNLTPGHGVNAQSSSVPYTVSLSQSTYKENEQITVTISGNNGHQGLMIQARKNDGSINPVGTFSQPSSNTKITSCTSNSDSWTHSNTGGKQISTVVWTAPSSNVGQIVFKATVAASKFVYWLNIQSPVVEFTVPTTTPEVTTTLEATTTKAATTTKEPTTSQEMTTPPTTSTQGEPTQGGTNSQTATTPDASNSDQSGSGSGTQTNTGDSGSNGRENNNASCLFTLVVIVTSLLIINKY